LILPWLPLLIVAAMLLLIAVATEGIVGMFCWCDVQKKKGKVAGTGRKQTASFPLHFQRADATPPTQ